MKRWAIKQIFAYIAMLAFTGSATSLFYFHKRGYLIGYSTGERLYQEKNFNAAIPYLMRAIEQGVDTRKAYFHLADSLTAIKQFDEAARVYNAYLEKDPNDKSARIRLARVLAYQGELAESTEQYQRALKEKK
ncbi:MAG: tetratricopeptide repeat protein [Chlamydiales bacterium]|nr:tetratricopeptide repeat protein [Chlamydiales bacterium]